MYESLLDKALNTPKCMAAIIPKNIKAVIKIDFIAAPSSIQYLILTQFEIKICYNIFKIFHFPRNARSFQRFAGCQKCSNLYFLY